MCAKKQNQKQKKLRYHVVVELEFGKGRGNKRGYSGWTKNQGGGRESKWSFWEGIQKLIMLKDIGLKVWPIQYNIDIRVDKPYKK